jgi:UDP-N-acetylmuramoyl-L-alanyl-D-glutamate--2,6-diaminopimelate ligase
MDYPVSNLGQLARGLKCSLVGSELVAPTGVAISSTFVERGFLFIACRGQKHHGLEFLRAAIDAGATALLTDTPGNYPIPYLLNERPREIAGELAARVFQTPRSGLFAVTGTNGKTSVAYYLRRLLEAMGEKTGLISSAGQIVGDSELVSELTTPEAPRIHQLLSQMRKAGQSRAVLEVSAQALVRNRVDGLHFQVSGFTNLSRDHLDDFSTMENYLDAKAELFSPAFSEKAVINVEDSWGEELLAKIGIPKVGIGQGLDYQITALSSTFAITGRQQLSANIELGPLMSNNLAVAVVMLMECGYFAHELTSAIEKIDLQIPGRLELVSAKRPHVYLDYAHTPEGVRAAVREIASRYPSLTVVLGASGNRDRGKRAEMGLALSGARKIFITDQHPRDEDPKQIRDQLLAATRTLSAEVFEEPDPASAIKRAVAETDQSSAVLWCGPGRLRYREIGGEKVPFDAFELARLAVEHD